MADKDKKTSKTKVTQTTIVKPKKPISKLVAPLYYMAGYFKGSWQELRKVRWPNRRATWGMTAAVIFFTGFFVALIIFLDWIFSQLFNLIIK